MAGGAQKGNQFALKPLMLRIQQNSIPEPNSGCHLWLGPLGPDGYPHQISYHGHHLRVSRAIYEWMNGPIPDGLVIDHICGIRCCVNPDHLRAVSQQINVTRGRLSKTLAARNTARKGTYGW